MPCSLIPGLDPLLPLIRAPLSSEVIPAEGGRYWIVASWVVEICEVAAKIEAACKEIHDHTVVLGLCISCTPSERHKTNLAIPYLDSPEMRRC